MQTLFVQTNEAENRVLAFRRETDGALTPIGRYETGGAGDGVPHLTSQGSVVLSRDGTRLLVTNAGSGDLSVFGVSGDALELIAAVATGSAPKSVAERDGLAYVLNTGEPSLVAVRIGDGVVEVIEDARRALPEGSDPAQVGLSPDGATLVVTERGTNAISTYPLEHDGYLGKRSAIDSAGPTPYGFAFAGATLVVTEAFGAATGKAAASSYVLRGTQAAPVTVSAGNGRSEICWAVASADGRYVFATNFADGAVSRYAVGADGALVLEDATAGLTEDGRSGLRDEDLTRDGRFLYAIDADHGSVVGWAVGDAGELTPIGSWNGLPRTVAGLAAG